MSKYEYFSRLVDLGREYCAPLLASFPNTRGATKADLERRCTWLEKAIELKPVDRELARNLFEAAWSSGLLSPTLAQQAGLA